MKKIISYLLALSFIVIIYGFQSNIKYDDEPAGKKIFIKNKCSSCHALKVANITTKKDKYPDLSDVGTKYDAEFLTKWILKEVTINDATHMKSYKGSDEDLKVLVGWLMSLSKDAVTDTTKVMNDKVDDK